MLSGPLRSVARPPLERLLVPSIVYACLLLGFPVKSFTSTNANVFEWKLRKLFSICGGGKRRKRRRQQWRRRQCSGGGACGGDGIGTKWNIYSSGEFPFRR